MHKKLFVALFCSLFIAGTAFAQSREEDETSSKEAPLPTGIHNNDGEGLKKARKYQILGIAPIQFTENGVGLSLSYEHGIDKGGIVTYIVPVIATFDLSQEYTYNGTHTYNNDPMFYIMPGVKFYPTSCYGKIKYAVGPSLVIGAGQETYHFYDYYGNTLGTAKRDRFIFGITISNSLNFQPTDHLYLGIDFGLGFTYINKLAGNSEGMSAITQGGFKIGYRL